MRGKNVALIFEKTSTRTRCAFEVGVLRPGRAGHLPRPELLADRPQGVGADTARVLSRMFDAIEFRGSAQATVETLAEFSDVPVYNGLTDEWHPTQMLADFLTMIEHGRASRSRRSPTPTWATPAPTWATRCSSWARSWVRTSASCAPKSLWPGKEIQKLAKERAALSGARITLTEDVAAGLKGADYVHTDVWVSMGEPKEVWDQRVKLLTPYQVNAKALKATGNKNAKFMHCLPAFHDTNTVVGKDIAEKTGMTEGLEVTDEVFESPANIAFDQAENRLHTIKAIMVATIGD